jgi:hypothetical protein
MNLWAPRRLDAIKDGRPVDAVLAQSRPLLKMHLHLFKCLLSLSLSLSLSFSLSLLNRITARKVAGKSLAPPPEGHHPNHRFSSIVADEIFSAAAGPPVQDLHQRGRQAPRHPGQQKGRRGRLSRIIQSERRRKRRSNQTIGLVPFSAAATIEPQKMRFRLLLLLAASDDVISDYDTSSKYMADIASRVST